MKKKKLWHPRGVAKSHRVYKSVEGGDEKRKSKKEKKMRMRSPVESNRLPWDSRQAGDTRHKAGTSIRSGRSGAQYTRKHTCIQRYQPSAIPVIETGCEGPRAFRRNYATAAAVTCYPIHVSYFFLFSLRIFFFFFLLHSQCVRVCTLGTFFFSTIKGR